MKAHDPGYWYQARMNVTNVNIFTNLTTQELINLTTAGVCPPNQARYIQALHSLVQLLHYWALIGWELHMQWWNIFIMMLRQVSYVRKGPVRIYYQTPLSYAIEIVYISSRQRRTESTSPGRTWSGKLWVEWRGSIFPPRSSVVAQPQRIPHGLSYQVLYR